MKEQQVRHWLTRLGELAAHPAAFGVIAVYAVAWLIFSPSNIWLECHRKLGHLVYDFTDNPH
jgi:hypothetical protein